MNHQPFVPLNLPPRLLSLGRDRSGRVTVYDILRHKWLVLTPEEWVRQHVTHHLISDLGYPKSLMANEVGLNLNGLTRRCDSILWNAADGTPLMVMEYKAPSVGISQLTFKQIARYNLVFRAKYLLVSNGVNHYFCHTTPDGRIARITDRIPPFSSLSDEEQQ